MHATTTVGVAGPGNRTDEWMWLYNMYYKASRILSSYSTSEICSAGAPDRVIFEFWIVCSAMGAHTASRFANAIRRGRRVSFLSGNWIVDLRNARRADNTFDVRDTSRIARRLKSHRPGLSLMSTVRKQLFVGKGSCQSVDHSFADPFLKRGGQ